MTEFYRTATLGVVRNRTAGRFCCHWGEYDELLVLPLIAFYRLARGPEPVRHARTLFALGSVALMAPITPMREYASWALVMLWLLQLALLASVARLGRATMSA